MKTMEEIYQEMLEEFAAQTGRPLDLSCDLAVRFSVLAAQLQALGYQAEWVLDQSFPQTAQGVYLDRHAAMRGLKRTEAVRAVGTLRFEVKTPAVVSLHIPAGTVCMTEEEVRFQTTEECVIPVGGTSAQAPAQAVEAGKGGNVAAGVVTILTACPVAVTACKNLEAFRGGSDCEDDETLRGRILESYRRLPNGANAAYYETTAMGHSGVAAARAVGRARGIGTVDVYIATEAGVPSPALVQEVQSDLQEKREIAVDVQVLAPETRTVDLSVEVAPAQGFTQEQARAEADQAIRELFNGKLLGKPVRLAQLGNQIYQAPGVENYHITAPAADLEARTSVLPVLGTVNITEMGGV